jgi:hypothetical protein
LQPRSNSLKVACLARGLAMHVGVIRAHAKIACVFTFILQITLVSAGLGPVATISEAHASDADAIKRIVECATAGQEAVLLTQGVECKDYRQGEKFVPPDMPMKLNAEEICEESADRPKDWRKLSEKAIKKIVGLTESVDPRGIRIFGGIFCKRLDLAGLNLAYSLVIDRSLFKDGFEARNFHTQGDLSFDGGLALGLVAIMRSRIDGTVFGQDAQIKELRILDTEVKGSLLFRASKIQEPAIFDTISLSGELSVRNARLSYLVLQFSKVGGVLDLTESQARCAYLIRKSEIGDLVAVQAGFGPSEQRSIGECAYRAIAHPGRFFVFDTSVRSSLCFRSFNWLAPTPDRIQNFVTFNDVKVGATTFIDLARAKADDGKPLETGTRKFEGIGIKTHSFIFNFKAGADMHEMSVGGLAFEQAYAVPAGAVVPCAYDPKYYERPSGEAEPKPQLESVGGMRLPQVGEIMDWVDKNCLQTTQPLSAFVDAAKRAGDVTQATELQMAKASKELGLRSFRVFRTILGTGPIGVWILGGDSTSNCVEAPEPLTEIGPASTGSITPQPVGVGASSTGSITPELVSSIGGSATGSIGTFLNLINDAAAVVFGTILWILAGHGYRPQQVGWLVLLTLILALAYLRLWARVVAFMPADQNTIRGTQLPIDENQGTMPSTAHTSTSRPIGIVFLFDRMLPAYKIREENYNVGTYYKRASKGSDFASVTKIKLFWGNILVVKADSKDVARVERCLGIIKALGIVFALFLVGAINAMIVSH